jgi:hypothetical protein
MLRSTVNQPPDKTEVQPQNYKVFHCGSIGIYVVQMMPDQSGCIYRRCLNSLSVSDLSIRHLAGAMTSAIFDPWSPRHYIAVTTKSTTRLVRYLCNASFNESLYDPSFLQQPHVVYPPESSDITTEYEQRSRDALDAYERLIIQIAPEG